MLPKITFRKIKEHVTVTIHVTETALCSLFHLNVQKCPLFNRDINTFLTNGKIRC